MGAKVATVVGARPQFVKAATVSRALAKRRDEFSEVLIHTGQHYDHNMSELFFKEMEIPRPTHNLGVGGVGHGAMTGRTLEALEQVFLEEEPDVVLVYGDTNATLAGALAAVKLHIPVAHVEAGLRSFNRTMPEEINRLVCDHCSTVLFAPTEQAVCNLEREGIVGKAVHRVGDVMYDAALYYRDKAAAISSPLVAWGLQPQSYLLATIHRQENTDSPERLRSLFLGLLDLARCEKVVLPLHPRTRSRVEQLGMDLSSITVIDPVGYLEMVTLESQARAILTDSGGVQKEAYFFGVPCLILRDETEWVELVDHSFARLVGAHRERIVEGHADIARMRSEASWNQCLYGRGDAAEEIVDRLAALLST